MASSTSVILLPIPNPWHDRSSDIGLEYSIEGFTNPTLRAPLCGGDFHMGVGVKVNDPV